MSDEEGRADALGYDATANAAGPAAAPTAEAADPAAAPAPAPAPAPAATVGAEPAAEVEGPAAAVENAERLLTFWQQMGAAAPAAAPADAEGPAAARAVRRLTTFLEDMRDGAEPGAPGTPMDGAETPRASGTALVGFSGAMPIRTESARTGFQIEAVPAWNPDPTVICNDCQEPCTKFRVKDKGQGTFRCNGCGYVHTRLYRDTPDYRNFLVKMSEGERIEFFRKSKVADAIQQRGLIDECQTKYKVRERNFQYGGEFKPLSAWAALGYDATIIETRSLPEDVMPCRMFGMVYRCPLLTMNVGGSEGSREQSMLAASQHLRHKKRLKAMGANDNVTEMKMETDSESDSSSSSESSSTSGGPKSKKDKKALKKKKAAKQEKRRAKKERKVALKVKAAQVKATREEKAAALLVERKAKQEQRDADAVQKRAQSATKTAYVAASKKLERAVDSVQKTLRSPGSDLVPIDAKANLDEILKQLLAAKTYVDAFVVGQMDYKEYAPSVDFVALVANAKKFEAVFHFNLRTFVGKHGD